MAGLCKFDDIVTGRCEVTGRTDHPRDFVGTWTTSSTDVKCNGQGLVRVNDTGTTDCGHHFVAVTGSSQVTNGGFGLVRVGDLVSIIEPGGGVGVVSTGSADSTCGD